MYPIGCFYATYHDARSPEHKVRLMESSMTDHGAQVNLYVYCLSLALHVWRT